MNSGSRKWHWKTKPRVSSLIRTLSRSPSPAASRTSRSQQLRFQGIAIDRILGLPDGNVTYVEDGFVQAVMTAQ
ncbi:hypothetical protein [Bosea sp. BIWAKO-01]|uniref:hypothetical protein n=1 Tax=Bosea sp. BIWAKO-01 TaxID=506668 RepID=UPI001FCDC623|nr:hypothetical protein [Bosea sp. BIWAKO-01]